jgi:hypothetical protein
MPDEEYKAIRARIARLNQGLIKDIPILLSEKEKFIPWVIAKSSVENLLKGWLTGPIWEAHSVSAGINKKTPKGTAVEILAWELRPVPGGPFNHWVIPPQYQDGGLNPGGLRFHECFLIRVAFLFYSLSARLMGPMVGQTIRDYYRNHDLEYQAFRKYSEEDLVEAGLKLIDPEYSQRHARDTWPQDDYAAYKRGELDGLGRPVK